MSSETTTQNIKEVVIELIRQNDEKALHDLFESTSSKDIVYLFSHLTRTEQIELLTLLRPEDAAEVIEEIPEVQAVDIIEDMPIEDAAAIIVEMESDEQVDLIQDLVDENAQAILGEMAPEEAASIRKLLTYPEDSAGGLMHTEFFVFKEKQTINEVVNELQRNKEVYKHYLLKKIFVTNQKDKLTGLLEMQDLLFSPPDAILGAIARSDYICVDHYDSFETLEEFFDNHDHFGVPVVDEQQNLMGILLRRDVLEEETERVAREHLESQGIVGGEELRTMPILLRARRRLSWLSVNIILNIIAASVIAYHQDVLTSVIALAVFLPIISDMSGCSGNQAVAVSMRELSIGVVAPREVFRVWIQEVSVGLINGLVLGLLIGLAAILWEREHLFGV